MSALAAPAPALLVNETARPARLESLDLLRGAVMIVMALDHVRDYISEFPYSPTDLDHTTAALFFTRWITHFCAPVFVFLAGSGAFLSLGRGKTKGQLSRFLLSRGLFLIILEQTVMRIGWQFTFRVLPWSGVLFAIGFSMIALAGFVHLPRAATLATSIAVLCLHNTLDGFHGTSLGSAAWVWGVLHQPGIYGHYADGTPVFRVLYPVLPWIAVMALGYAVGPAFKLPTRNRHRVLYATGIAMTLAFVVLRWIDAYGNLSHRTHYSSILWSALSFLDCTKYPPSLDYVLMTLGPGIAILPLLESARSRLSRAVLVYGRVPMFYYVLHIYLAHLTAVALAWAAGKTIPWRFPPSMPHLPANFGFPLWTVYAVWIFVVLALFPACQWWAHLKRTRSDWWLSYL